MHVNTKKTKEMFISSTLKDPPPPNERCIATSRHLAVTWTTVLTIGSILCIGLWQWCHCDNSWALWVLSSVTALPTAIILLRQQHASVNTFLKWYHCSWFLLISMLHFLHVAVSLCLNCSFVHLSDYGWQWHRQWLHGLVFHLVINVQNAILSSLGRAKTWLQLCNRCL